MLQFNATEAHLLPAAGTVLDRIFSLQSQLLAYGCAIIVMHSRYTTAAARELLFLVVRGSLAILDILGPVPDGIGIQRHFIWRMYSFCRSEASTEDNERVR